MISLAFHHDKIVAATVSDGGDFVQTVDIATPKAGYREWLLAAREAVDGLGSANAAASVAVALPAIIDGDAASFTPIAALRQSSLRRDLQSALGRAVGLFGFGDCLAAAQARDLRDTDMIVALWIGQSCHGGVRVNGGRMKGAHGGAGNWAHLQLPSPVPHELDGRHCWCGRSGCLETFLSQSGFEDDYERVTGDRQPAASIAAAAAASDIVADSVVQVFEDRLGRATATIITLFDPQVIVLGGAATLVDRLCERVPRKWPGYVQIDRSRTRIIACSDDDSVLLTGAAVLMSEA